MQEKVLKHRKNGMPVLCLLILLYLAALAGFIVSGMQMQENTSPLFAFLTLLCVVWMLFGWILFFGLKILRPQEALVLTLFGKYVGTLKEEGFYFVNPFCSSVNPAAKTRLSQSGDVKEGEKALFIPPRPLSAVTRSTESSHLR